LQNKLTEEEAIEVLFSLELEDERCRWKEKSHSGIRDKEGKKRKNK